MVGQSCRNVQGQRHVYVLLLLNFEQATGYKLTNLNGISVFPGDWCIFHEIKCLRLTVQYNTNIYWPHQFVSWSEATKTREGGLRLEAAVETSASSLTMMKRFMRAHKYRSVSNADDVIF